MTLDAFPYENSWPLSCANTSPPATLYCNMEQCSSSSEFCRFDLENNCFVSDRYLGF